MKDSKIESSFCHLRLQSHFSNFSSIIKLKQLANFCKKRGNKYCGITDYMNLFGVVGFCNEMKKVGIKPIIGVILEITNFGQIPVYVINEKGYKNLCYILSQPHIHDRKTIHLEELEGYVSGLIALTGTNSVVSQSPESNQSKDFISRLKILFKTNLLIELDFHDKNNFNLLCKISHEEQIPIILTAETKFLEEDDAKFLYIFDCISKNRLYQEEELNLFQWKNYYYQKDFTDIDFRIKDAMENTISLAKKCNFSISNYEYLMPSYIKTKEEKSLSSKGILYKKIWNGLRAHLKGEIPEIYRKRAEFEMDVLVRKNFCDYFLVTSDFVNFAHKNNILVGTGRGSGVGSLIAYAIGITSVDPIKFDLLFERFLNPERNSLPDFDIDFQPDRREDVIEYIRDKYGKYNVMPIITYIFLQSRAVIRDVGRVHGLPYGLLNKITNLIPQDQVNPMDLSGALQIVGQLRDMREKYPHVFEASLKLEGLMRNLSKHAAGVVISDIPIYDRCPLFSDAKGVLVTQYNLKYLEKVGFVKFDFLSLKTLSILNRSIENIKKNHNITIKLNEIPLNDQKVFSYLRNSKNLALEGIFQFESTAIRAHIHSLKPTNINDLIALNALYRPGPMKYISSYNARKNGLEKIEYPHQSTEKILCETYGIIVYQEQVMQIARVCAGYTMAEADLLRRAMGKKNKAEMAMHVTKFMEGCKKNNISSTKAEHLFKLIETFAGYGFNKSHSAAYSIIAYYCLYLKVHYRDEFSQAYLTYESGNIYKITKYIYELLTYENYIIKGPCIHNSEIHCSVKDKKLYYGLTDIKGIQTTAAEHIIKNRPYKDIYDFMNKNASVCKKNVWGGLVYSGALDNLHFNSYASVNNNLGIFDKLIKQNDSIRGTLLYKLRKRLLFFNNASAIAQGVLLSFNAVKHVSMEDELKKNVKYMGITNQHGSSYLKNLYPVLSLSTIHSFIFNSRIKDGYVYGDVILLQRRRKGNSLYAFVEIGDHTAIIDFPIFSGTLEKYGNLLKIGSSFIFQLKKKFNRIGVIKIISIDEFLQTNITSMNFKILHINQLTSFQQNLQHLIEGDIPLYLSGTHIKNIAPSLNNILILNNIDLY